MQHKDIQYLFLWLYSGFYDSFYDFYQQVPIWYAREMLYVLFK